MSTQGLSFSSAISSKPEISSFLKVDVQDYGKPQERIPSLSEKSYQEPKEEMPLKPCVNCTAGKSIAWGLKKSIDGRMENLCGRCYNKIWATSSKKCVDCSSTDKYLQWRRELPDRQIVVLSTGEIKARCEKCYRRALKTRNAAMPKKCDVNKGKQWRVKKNLVGEKTAGLGGKCHRPYKKKRETDRSKKCVDCNASETSQWRTKELPNGKKGNLCNICYHKFLKIHAIEKPGECVDCGTNKASRWRPKKGLDGNIVILSNGARADLCENCYRNALKTKKIAKGKLRKRVKTCESPQTPPAKDKGTFGNKRCASAEKVKKKTPPSEFFRKRKFKESSSLSPSSLPSTYEEGSLAFLPQDSSFALEPSSPLFSPLPPLMQQQGLSSLSSHTFPFGETASQSLQDEPQELTLLSNTQSTLTNNPFSMAASNQSEHFDINSFFV